MRQAGLVIEFDDGGLCIGAQLGRGGAEGVGGLQVMPPLNAATTMTALAEVDVELPTRNSIGSTCCYWNPAPFGAGRGVRPGRHTHRVSLLIDHDLLIQTETREKNTGGRIDASL